MMNQLAATVGVLLIILAAITTTSLGWRYVIGTSRNSAERNWRLLLTFVALVLVSLSVLLLAAYMGRNALFKPDPNGDWTTLTFIRAGNYLSLIGLVVSLAGKGKARWLVFIGGCLMLFIWFSQGMSL